MDPIIFIRIIGENPFSAYIPSPDGGIFPFRTSASTLPLPTPHARIADNNEKSGSVALPPLRSDRNRITPSGEPASRSTPPPRAPAGRDR